MVHHGSLHTLTRLVVCFGWRAGSLKKHKEKTTTNNKENHINTPNERHRNMGEGGGLMKKVGGIVVPRTVQANRVMSVKQVTDYSLQAHGKLRVYHALSHAAFVQIRSKSTGYC